MILRPGAITLAMLEDAVGEVDVDPAVRMAAGLESHVTPKAPGMKYRHYAPETKCILINYEDPLDQEFYINQQISSPITCSQHLQIYLMNWFLLLTHQHIRKK